ncbi:uncharacterized protein LOC115573565 [Sparus aurata]|uniref:uncharacterized protein LOC115573565 n=1 Tax=Sparus aurata TaxID=8175 RepID=UPI0011C114FC|nr:uncharacterized protein LOC115573565 [Sparus aurata]
MSDLLRKIGNINSDAVGVLQSEGLRTDSAIKSLSQDDLRYLFPGTDKFQMRRSIYEIIHKPEPDDAVFKEWERMDPCDSLQGDVMSELMRKIGNINRDAALVLQSKGLCTDSAIKSLSQDDLRSLFPGTDKFQMRRSIYEIIHKPEPVDAVFKELKEFVPFDSLLDALKNDRVLDYLCMLKEIKGQVDNVQRFLQAHIDNLEGLKNAEPQQNTDKGGVITGPVSDTSLMEFDSSQTGDQSQRAHGFSSGTGSSGTSGPLVPYSDPNGHKEQGAGGFSSGKGSSSASGPHVPYSGPNSDYSQGAGGFSSGKGSSSASGPHVPYSGPNSDYSQGAGGFSSGKGSSGASGPPVPYSGPNSDYSQFTRGAVSRRGPSFGGPLQRSQVLYKSVVSGKTFRADEQLIEKMEQQGQDGVRLVQTRENHMVTVLFCPISSRVGADVDAAMSDVEDDDKDVILVLMHHVREPKPTTNIRTWTAYEKVVLHVHVFYHETNNGLLTCPQNNDAFSLIWNKLLKYKTPDTSGNALGVGDERGHTTNRVRNNSSGNSSSGSKCYQS